MIVQYNINHILGYRYVTRQVAYYPTVNWKPSHMMVFSDIVCEHLET